MDIVKLGTATRIWMGRLPPSLSLFLAAIHFPMHYSVLVVAATIANAENIQYYSKCKCTFGTRKANSVLFLPH